MTDGQVFEVISFGSSKIIEDVYLCSESWR